MDDFLSSNAHWIWITIGIVLAALEMLVPGVYLIWLAVAAIVTGLLTLGLGVGLPMQIILFVSISLIAAYSAKRFLRDHPIESSDPLLNQRGSQMIGQIAVVTQAFEGGTGRVKHGDSEWLARGPDCAEGARVRITGSEGTQLVVEAVDLLVPPENQPHGSTSEPGGA